MVQRRVLRTALVVVVALAAAFIGTGSMLASGTPSGAAGPQAGASGNAPLSSGFMESIEVCKDVVPDDFSEWDFGLEGPRPGIATGLGDGECYDFGAGETGFYTLSEVPRLGYDTTIDCGGKGTAVATTIVLNMGVGEAVTCWFTNTIQPGLTQTLTVAKEGLGAGTVTSIPAGIDCGADCTESYVQYTVVQLTAVADAGSVFLGWSGNCSGTSPITLVALDDDKTCRATFGLAAGPRSLEVIKAGAGSVTSAPAGIDCGSVCEATFALYSTVYLTADPDAGSVFAGWSGDCGGTVSPFPMWMDDNKICTATFEPVATVRIVEVCKEVQPEDASLWNFTLEGPGLRMLVIGLGDGECQTLDNLPGGTYTLSEITTAGYSTSVECPDRASDTDNDVTFDLGDGDHVTCFFTNVLLAGSEFTLEVVKAGAGTVTSIPAGINCGVDCTEDYAQYTTVALTALPAGGSTFVGWSGDCSGVLPIALVSLDADKTCTATFEVARTLNVWTAGTGGGTVSSVPPGINCPSDCAEGYPHGMPVLLTAAADEGDVFAGWSGDCAGADPTATVTMNGDKSCTATFMPGASINVCKEVDPDDASVWDFALSGPTPANAYGLGDTECQLLNSLAEGSYTLSEVADANYATSVDCPGKTSDNDHDVDFYLSVGESITCTFTNQGSGGTVYLLEVSKAGSGGGTVTSAPPGIDCGGDCVQSYPESTVVQVSAAADGNSVFAGWSGDCSGSGATATVTMDADKACTAQFDLSTMSIQVCKDVDPEDGSLWDFTLAGPRPGSAEDLGDGDCDVFTNMPSGSYTLSEDLSSDYIASVDCGAKGANAGNSIVFDLNAGDSLSCTFLNTKKGTVTIIKDALPDDAQDFSFSGDLGDFTLDDDANATLPNSVTFSGLTPGAYNVSEASIPAGWDLASIVCNDPDGGTTTDLGTATASIDLDADEGIVCTFTNVKQGSITIVKDAVPDDAQDFSFSGDLGDFTLDDDANATLPNSATFSGLAPGAYNVSEASIPAGWNLSSIVCNDPDGGTTTDLGTATASIDLDADEGIVCTFTNGTLSVETATGTGIAAFDSDACAFEDLIAVAEATLPTAGKPNLDFEHGFFSFKLVGCSPGQTVNVSIAFPSNIPVGAQYWKYQDGVGWYQIPVGDDDGDNVLTIQLTDGGLGDSDGLVNGEIDDPGGPGFPLGTIIVEKQTNPDGSAGSFTFTGDAAGAIGDNGQIVVSNLPAGTYTVREEDAGPAFELTAISCNDGDSTGNAGTRTATFNVDWGERVKCTFTNAQRSLQVTKDLELPVGGLAAVDQIVRFLITVENDGGLTVDPVTLLDQYDSWCLTSRRAEIPPDVHGGFGGFLQWNDLGALAPGESLSLWVEFNAAHACEEATNTATVQTGGLSFEDEASLRILDTIARVGGYIFHDDNGDGTLSIPCRGTDVDPAGCEPGLELASSETTLPSGKTYQYSTNTSGWYSFNLLDPGTYHVDASPPEDSWWTPTTAEECDAAIVNNWDQVFCHFGYWWGLDGPPLLGPVADDTMTFHPTQDTFISGWEAGNHGAAEHVQVRQPDYSSTLLEFDRSGLPVDATPVWAKIKLYAPFASNSTNRLYMTAYPLDKPWVEDEATWLQAENGLPWTGAGATGDHGDPVGWAWIGAPGWVEFDLDPAELLANDYGYLVRGEGSGNREVSYWFFSREYVKADVRPQLVVGYNVP